MIDQSPYKGVSSESFTFPGFVIVLRRIGESTTVYRVKNGGRIWWGCASGKQLKILIVNLIRHELDL